VTLFNWPAPHESSLVAVYCVFLFNYCIHLFAVSAVFYLITAFCLMFSADACCASSTSLIINK
jgi:hypothetical protein